MPKEIFAKEYEEYLITGKEESLNNLPGGSIEKEYITLIRKILNEDLTDELQSQIDEFLKRIPENQSYRLRALNIFKKLQKNPEKKDEIIQNIKSLFRLGNVKSHNKPVKYNKSSRSPKEENDTQKLPSTFNLDEYVKINKFIQDIYDNKIIPNDIEYKKLFGDNYNNFNLDFNKIPEKTLVKILSNPKDYKKIKDAFSNSIIFANLDYFKKVCKLAYEECSKNEEKKKDFRNNLSNNVHLLLNEQIEALLNYNIKLDRLVSELINRKYFEIPEDKSERVKALKEIKALLNKYNYKDDKMTRNVLISILDLNAKMNVFELDTFIEYIEVPLYNNRILYSINKDLETKIINNNKQNDCFLSPIINIDYDEDQKLIEKYLKHFFLKDKIEFEKLHKYFNENYIKKFYAKMQFYLGKEQPTKDNIISQIEISDLMKEIQLSICEFNKETFNINDDIELVLEIKNIQTLYVNIFEINTENYYYSNKKGFEDSISLDGIVPTYEDIFSYNDEPQLLIEKTISLSKLPKKRGLYVVEFIGNGHVSRAVIQRGNLRCIHKNTVNGKVLYILDEDNKICKGEKTGLWINNVWYPSIKDSGAILIPYSINENIFILKHNDFCCLETNISIPDETYNFDGLFIINEESFIMGNVTKVLVRPYLFVCEELCPLENLKNIKLNINYVKTENNQDINSVLVIDNIELSYDKEFSFDFQVPPKLKSVNFELSGEIKPKTRDKIEVLKFSQNYLFNRRFEYDTLIKKNNNGNYIIHLLGKNGEPKKNHQVELRLEHKNQQINQDSILMETDLEGKLDLGTLTDVRNIQIDRNHIEIEQLPRYTYLHSMIILENQEMTLPFSNQNNNQIHLIKNINNNDIENLSHLLNIEITDQKNNLGNIKLPKLSKGTYKLKINEIEIDIKVIKGEVMDINDFIITEKGKIMYNNNVESSIGIENVSYENKELKIKLNKNNKSSNNPRVHINCVQYLPNKLNKNLIKFNQSQIFKYRIMKENLAFKVTKNKNKYLNNKILSDEMQYVLDRKQYDINLGNSLEKPSLLLKPQFIRDTNTEIKKGKEGEAFRDRMRNLCCNDECLCDECEDNYGGYYDESRRGIKVHDFINISPFIKENLIPNENGEIIIKDLDLNEYSFLHILCFDNISCNEDCFYLKNGKTSLRDLRATNEFDLNKNYCEFRKIYPLSKTDKHHINDITSIKYKIFDSLEKYIEFINIVNPSLIQGLKDFDFLINFDNLNLVEKLDKITQYFSHETNIYLYFHHNDFFNKYIYPILKYKSEKTFIDYFLLDDKEKIKEFMDPQEIKKLNAFEKCLLIYLIKKDNKELAFSLARQIRTESPIQNERELKRLFNIALNLKSIEEIKEDSETFAKLSLKHIDANINSMNNINSNKKLLGNARAPRLMNCCKIEAPMAAPPMMKAMKINTDSVRLFSVPLEAAERINVKAQLFKEEGKSKEFCETQYYNKVFKNTDSQSFVKSNHFFADLAKYWCENDSIRNIGFKSENILLKPDNLTQIIFILAVLDLEEKTLPQAQNFIKDKGLGLTIEANTNGYLLTKEINETELNNDNKYALILAQMVFEADNVNKDDEKEPTKFLTNRTYLQKTIVTNISPDRITCEVLMQIPEGSIPVDSDEYKVIETADINSYISVSFEQKFYFPEEGNFKQYPASASINDLVIAKSGLKTYEVVSNIQLSKEEISSIDDVLNQGNKKEILEFINNSKVIKEEDLEKIYWMLKDKDFYKQLIDILKNKYFFNDDIWEYASNNEDIDSLQEYIYNHKDKEIFKSIGHELDLKFIKLDKTNNAHILNHLDYYPILKNRFFKLPKSKSILSVQLRETYQNYISYLITLPKINDYEYMRLCYYLILQQRIEEASIIFEKINKQNVVENELTSYELQYDYLTAYLDFCKGYPKFEKARELIKKYKDITISNWKNMFNEIEDQLNEYDKKIDFDKKITNEEKELSKKEKHKAETEEILSIEKKDQDTININYKNISDITVKYYLIDIEILFSRSPFVKKTKIDFNLVKPQKTEKFKVDNVPKENKYLLKIPEELKNKNFYIEISSGKKKEKEIYYSSLLQYSVLESIGEIKVLDPKKNPLPKVYVKCFCETNSGDIKFYKDGFTDLRGKFDYVSLNTDLVNEVKRFSLLMVSKEYGSIITIINPPKIIKDSNGTNNIEKMFDYKQQLRNKFKNKSFLKLLKNLISEK